MHWATESTALSRAKSFVGFGRFLFYILGFEALDYFVSSKRLEGTAIPREKAMQPKTQAELLTAQEIRQVQVATESEELSDEAQLCLTSAIAKAALRSRFYDSKGVVQIGMERGRVVAKTTSTKTAGTGSMRDLQIMMVPKLFLMDQPWLDVYLNRRRQLQMLPEQGWPPMPSKDKWGIWSRRPLRLGD